VSRILGILKKNNAQIYWVAMNEINSMWGSPKTMENSRIYKFFGFQQSRSVENSEPMEEFNEEDIWGGAIDAEASHTGFPENGCNGVEECAVGKKERRKISMFHEENNRRRINQSSSAPVNIPQRCDQMPWEEKRKIENCWTKRHGMISDYNSSSNVEAGNFGRNMIPPHELIAMQRARKEIASFSECKGVGKTLKGRDAVWTMIGFIE